MPAPSRDEIYRAVIRKMVMKAFEDQELAFEEAHGEDSNMELLQLLRQQAEDLGHSPRYKEIPGCRLYEQRFGSWNASLAFAGLASCGKCALTKLPRYLEEEKRQKELYRQRKAEKKLLAEQRRLRQEEKKLEAAKKKQPGI